MNYKAPYELVKKEGDIGYDLQSLEDIFVEPNQTVLVSTGVYLELDEGYYADLRPRSGNSGKGLVCQLGLIDTNYRGEIKACITNNTRSYYYINKGDRVAQLVIRREEIVELDRVEEIDKNTNRGEKGFGSSGR